jgi:hypothetical protein
MRLLIAMGKFPAPWGGIFSPVSSHTVSARHCKTEVRREACVPECSDTAPQGARMFILTIQFKIAIY